jgi:hypothetical protein
MGPTFECLHRPLIYPSYKTFQIQMGSNHSPPTNKRMVEL